MATTECSVTMRTARATTVSGVVDDRTRLAARGKRPVRLVRAIGENFRGDPQTGRPPGVQNLGSWKSEEDQRLVERRDGARDRGGELRVADRHVEQRAVRLHVLDRDAFGRRDAGHGGDLVQHEVFGFLRRDVQLAPSEADEIRKARMRADRDAMRFGKPDGGAKDGRIAGVKSGCDVRRRD